MLALPLLAGLRVGRPLRRPKRQNLWESGICGCCCRRTSRGEVQPTVGLALHSRALGRAEAYAAELVAAQFDTVAAAAEEWDTPVEAGLMPTGGKR